MRIGAPKVDEATGTLSEFYAVLREPGKVFVQTRLGGDQMEWVEASKQSLYRALRGEFPDSGKWKVDWVEFEDGSIGFQVVYQ